MAVVSDLNILLLEDNALDAELIILKLRAGGVAFRPTHVQTRQEFVDALHGREFDLILSDFSLPGFDGISALEIAQRCAPEVPFLFVSGALGEDLAIDTLKRGATDFVVKQRLDRLVPAVRRALGEVEARIERKRAQESLRFLSRASELLGTSLDYGTTIEQLAELALDGLADACVIDTIEDDATLRRHVAGHPDAPVATLQRLGPDDRDGSGAFAQVLGTARVLVLEVDAEDRSAFDAAFPRRAERRALGELGVRSVLIVPLRIGEQILGSLVLLRSQGTPRSYGPNERALAEELARRAALAIDNARLHRATEAARRDAEAASRAKDRFLAMLSHELRTPLTPVMLTVNALLDEPQLNESVRSALETIRRNVGLEASLIEDLLDVTRIVQGKLTLKREVVDVHPLIQQALIICQDEISSGKFTVEPRLDAVSSHVDGDPRGSSKSSGIWSKTPSNSHPSAERS